MTKAFILTVLSGCVFASSCAITEVRDASGLSTRKVSFPTLAVNVAPTDGVIGNVRSVGIIRSPVATTLGYAHHRIVIDEDQCKVVIWVENGEHVQAVREITESLDGVCVQ